MVADDGPGRLGGDWVSLGLATPDGFDGSDLVSSAEAASSGALPDLAFETDQDGHLPVEFRIHGVSGSTGAVMLCHPQVIRVGGKSPTGIYRRWSPGGTGRLTVPRPAEAYSWGGLTERPLLSALWVLLSPFMLFNVAHFMLPARRRTVPAEGQTSAAPGHDAVVPSRSAWCARAMLRLCALAVTVQFTLSLYVVLVSTIGWQNGFVHLADSWWDRWYTHRATDVRVGLGVIVVALIVAGLWAASALTVSRYESVAITTEQPNRPRPDWAMAAPHFWHRPNVVSRHAVMHVLAAVAFVSLVTALIPHRQGQTGAGVTRDQVWVAAVLLGLAVVAVVAWADRDTRPRTGNRAVSWLLPGAALVYLAELAWVVVSAMRSLDAQGVKAATALPLRLAGTSTVVLVALAGLLILLLVWVTVARLAARAGSAPTAGWKPFIGGFGTVWVTLLAVAAAGMLTAALNIGVARLFGQPTGLRLSVLGQGTANKAPIVVPDEVFVYAVALAVGVLGVAVFAIGLAAWWRRQRSSFAAEPSAGGAGGSDRVRNSYPASLTPSDASTLDSSVRKVAGAWATAALTDWAGVAIAVFGASWAIAVVLAEVYGLAHANVPVVLRHNGLLAANVLVWLGSAVGAIFAVGGVWLLRSVFKDGSSVRAVGAVWDVATFWPRAAHPLAPPCYAEQAVPEIVDRLTYLTFGQSDPARLPDPARQPDPAPPPAPAGPDQRALPSPAWYRPRKILLTGYSQGAILAAAVVAQLGAGALSRVSLLTLANPLRRLYARAFPAYFGEADVAQLRERLATPETGEPPSEPIPDALVRWRNLVRHTDYIGSWVLAPPPAPGGVEYLGVLDVPSLDPPSLIPSGAQLAPIHYHSAWWQDPLALVYGAALIDGDEPGADSSRRCGRIGWLKDWLGKP